MRGPWSVEVTIREHRKRLRTFLGFLRFDRNPSRLQQLRPQDINAFVRQCARTNNPLSLRHIVATLRAFLQWRHARGLPENPIEAFRLSGYLERITKERCAKNAGSVSSYA